MALKLGKKLPPRFNELTLSFARYLKPAISFPKPPFLYRANRFPDGAWGMFGNDIAGDCTCASKAHMMMLMNAYAGRMYTPNPRDIMQAYINLTGYNPATGANDNGCAMTDVFNYWQTTGIGGHKILGWAQVDHNNIDRIKQAIYLFGAVDIGFNFPQSAMDQFNNNHAWSVLNDDGGIIGGHDVPLFSYDPTNNNCVTWGQRQTMTWDFFSTYCDEAYAVITKDWLNSVSGLSASLLDLAALTDDLAAIAA